jgi:hypothetical protein
MDNNELIIIMRITLGKGGLGQRIPELNINVDNKLTKSRKSTKDNPCSKKSPQREREREIERDCLGKFKQRRKWSCGDPKF